MLAAISLTLPRVEEQRASQAHREPRLI